ncbi:MAG: 4-hydroxy-3-methylbut-2-enyl diphosphate reductase [Candidatus Omnitrophica bacterium]|nr:4-hydroxy-3-methylbut-2-enyl diphosphate reductase [Candidatus Omnitrophota bacterium]MDD5591985.1 4-hydroxy-3-methylbut-2-enyl diphosphate reductase [Candidatus Omnitrophota bacterium]
MRGIKLAKNIGFCLGVKRAIDIVEGALNRNKGIIYSLGPVIHNPEVIKRLERRGLCVVKSLDNLKESSVLILPSHGTARNILKTAKKKKLRLIDVTCPYVSLVQKTCAMLHEQGLEVIIIGERRHPEIKALLDLAIGAHTIDRIKDIKQGWFSYRKIGIISQTTQAQDMFFKIVNKILEKNPLVKEVHIYNTICLDTARRQDEAGKLAKSVDVLLVVGSRLSANTKRLFSIGRKINKRTYLVENKGTPLSGILKKADRVGLISGASTPEWLVGDIVKKISSRKEK